MQQALEKKQENGERADDGTPQAGEQAATQSAAEREKQRANEAWLRRVPDDPGGLLRAKFRLEYERRRKTGERRSEEHTSELPSLMRISNAVICLKKKKKKKSTTK